MSEECLGPPRVSVIIPVLNSAGMLSGCLDSLEAQTVERSGYELIIVDDGSTDGSGEVAAHYGVTLIRQAHAGAAAARNRGARRATGSILLFTDADCEPAADWIERMLAPFSDPDVAGVKGAYRTRQRSLVARFAQAEYEEKYDQLVRLRTIDFVDTYAAGYRREVFFAHGGFDPAFLLDEDQELSYRLAEAGHRLLFVPTAVVYHLHAATLARYFCRKMQLGRWKVQVAARHPAKVVRDSYTPWTQKAQILLIPILAGTLVASWLGWVSWLLSGALLALSMLTVFPLMTKAVPHGWDLVAAAPVFVLLRALALDLGIVWGLAGLRWQGK